MKFFLSSSNVVALFPLNPLLSSRYDPFIICFFSLHFCLYSSFIFWQVNGKHQPPFFSLQRCLMLLFLLCWSAPEITLQRHCLALIPEIPLPSPPCPFWFLYLLLSTHIRLNQSVSFPYLVLFWLHKHHLALLFSLSTLRLLPPILSWAKW